MSSHARPPSFDAFVRSRYSSLVRYAYTLTAGDPDPEDVIQDVLLKVLAHWDKLDNPEAYIRVAASREVFRRRRRWRERRAEAFDELLMVQEHQSLTALYEQRDLAVRLMRSLPPKQRVVISLRYLYDMDEGEVARMLGIAIGTVKSQTARGLRTLRERPDFIAEYSPRRQPNA